MRRAGHHTSAETPGQLRVVDHAFRPVDDVGPEHRADDERRAGVPAGRARFRIGHGDDARVRVLVGAEGDRDAGREIESALPSGVTSVNLIGRTDLGQLAGAVVGVDFGAVEVFLW